MPKIFRFFCVLLLSLSALALQAGDPLNYFVYPYVEVDGKKWENISSQFSFADAGMVATRDQPLFVNAIPLSDGQMLSAKCQVLSADC